VSFASDLQTIIVAPLLHAKQMVSSYPYLTRLFTTLSPELMTLDPEFDYNSTLGDISQITTAKATAICGVLQSQPSAVRIDLPDGRSFYVSYSGGPLDQGPNAQVVEQLSPNGPPVIITDNSAAIDKIIAPHGCSCGTGLEPFALCAAVAGMGLLRRRRR